MSNGTEVHNEKRLFWASFLVLIAAGIGFSIRGAILKDWGSQFGFTQTELGVITGFGLTGFGVTIIFFSLFADRWGYGPLMTITFLLHFVSAIVTILATPMFHIFGQPGAFWCLAIGTTMFALGNGTSEAVINPLTATLYPKQKTHYLNILHAGWPGGLILGALLGLALVGKVPWEISLAIYAIPTVGYGFMFLRQKFPVSEAHAHGVTIGTMLKEFASPILLFLLVLHACVGYVELGTDSWIQNITGTILSDPSKGTILFIIASTVMFILRFCAGPIVHKISPIGLLAVSAFFGVVGLWALSKAGDTLNFGAPFTTAMIAILVYGFSKTFYWPTMLGVVSERFPKGGALTLGAMGGCGMLSAGLLGGPGIGFSQDYFASQKLQETSNAAFERYKAAGENSFLFFHTTGLDGSKVSILADEGAQLKSDAAVLAKANKTDENNAKLVKWWSEASKYEKEDKASVLAVSLYGSRMALLVTAGVPAFMFLGYVLLALYFRSQGGYKQVHIEGMGKAAHETA
jgi:MFS family permease